MGIDRPGEAPEPDEPNRPERLERGDQSSGERDPKLTFNGQTYRWSDFEIAFRDEAPSPVEAYYDLDGRSFDVGQLDRDVGEARDRSEVADDSAQAPRVEPDAYRTETRESPQISKPAHDHRNSVERGLDGADSPTEHPQAPPQIEKPDGRDVDRSTAVPPSTEGMRTAADSDFAHHVEARPEHTPEAQRWLPACKRAEWQQPLLDGEVDQVGKGIVDERARQLLPEERRIADYLALTDSSAVVAVDEEHGVYGPTPDAKVDDVVTEFKYLFPGASDTSVKAALNSANHQRATEAVLDGRDTDLSAELADRGVRRYRGQPWEDRIECVRIVTTAYDRIWNREDR